MLRSGHGPLDRPVAVPRPRERGYNVYMNHDTCTGSRTANRRRSTQFRFTRSDRLMPCGAYCHNLISPKPDQRRGVAGKNFFLRRRRGACSYRVPDQTTASSTVRHTASTGRSTVRYMHMCVICIWHLARESCFHLHALHVQRLAHARKLSSRTWLLNLSAILLAPRVIPCRARYTLLS